MGGGGGGLRSFARRTALISTRASKRDVRKPGSHPLRKITKEGEVITLYSGMKMR